MPGPALDFTRVRAVTFDSGGTLLTPHPGVGEVYAEVLARFAVSIPSALLNQRFRAAFHDLTAAWPRPEVNEAAALAFWREIVRRCLTPECPENLVPQIFAEVWEEFARPPRWRVLPGVAEALSALAARQQFRLAVLSNWDARLPRVLAGFAWARHFERVFISSEIGAEKPDPRAFRAVESALALPPAACLHVGDSYAHDYQAAQAAGWQALLLTPAPPADNPTLNQIPSLVALPALLAKL